MRVVMSDSDKHSAPSQGAPASSLVRFDAETCHGLLAEGQAPSTSSEPQHGGTPLDVACGVPAELDLEVMVVIDRLLESARVLTGAQSAALGVLDSSGAELEQFITSGIDQDLCARTGMPPRGCGVLGALICDPVALLAEVGAHPRSCGFPLETSDALVLGSPDLRWWRAVREPLI